MPVSSKRKKPNKKSSHPQPAKRKSSPAEEYVEDFLDDVIVSLDPDDFALVSVIEGSGEPDDEFKHYYVLSRDETGKLLEHNEGPVFRDAFVKALSREQDDSKPVKIVVGYFPSDQVDIKPGGLNFRKPYFAVQWKAQGRKFIPDNSEYNWNGYAVHPGGEVDRSF